MARPSVNDRYVSFRTPSEDFAGYTAKAVEAGMPVSMWIRHILRLVLQGKVK